MCGAICTLLAIDNLLVFTFTGDFPSFVYTGLSCIVVNTSAIIFIGLKKSLTYCLHVQTIDNVYLSASNVTSVENFDCVKLLSSKMKQKQFTGNTCSTFTSADNGMSSSIYNTHTRNADMA